MGQKVAIERPRERTIEHQEVKLASYETFYRDEPLTEIGSNSNENGTGKLALWI
jgi:hypothetical protein